MDWRLKIQEDHQPKVAKKRWLTPCEQCTRSILKSLALVCVIVLPFALLFTIFNDRYNGLTVVAVCVLTICCALGICFKLATIEPECDCEINGDVCLLDHNRLKGETRSDAAFRRLKHYFYPGPLGSQNIDRFNATVERIISEVEQEMPSDLKEQLEVFQSEKERDDVGIYNGCVSDARLIRTCINYNIGECSFMSGHKVVWPQDLSSDSNENHICLICEGYLGAGLVHPAIDCKLLKLMDQKLK